jgi:hypothetical protein
MSYTEEDCHVIPPDPESYPAAVALLVAQKEGSRGRRRHAR